MHACFGGNLFGSGVEYFLAVPGACSFLDDDNRVQYDVMAGGLTFSPSPLCEISTKFAPVTKTKIHAARGLHKRKAAFITMLVQFQLKIALFALRSHVIVESTS